MLPHTGDAVLWMLWGNRRQGRPVTSDGTTKPAYDRLIRHVGTRSRDSWEEDSRMLTAKHVKITNTDLSEIKKKEIKKKLLWRQYDLVLGLFCCQ